MCLVLSNYTNVFDIGPTGLLSCNNRVDDMTALKTNNKEFGDVYSRSILNVKI